MERSKAYTKDKEVPTAYHYLVSQLDLILTDETSADGQFRLAKTEGTIQYGYMTWGTHAPVFFQTLAHVNSKNEIRQRNRRRW